MIEQKTIIYKFKAQNWVGIAFLIALNGCASSWSERKIRKLTVNTPQKQQAQQISGQSIAVEINGQASTRNEAQQQVLNEGVREGLKKFLRDTTSDDLFDAIRRWTDKLKANQYKPLVKRWLLDIDQIAEGNHYLQGKLILDYNSLHNFAKRYMAEQHRFFGRFSYLLTLDSGIRRSRDELKLSNRFISALEQRFINTGFNIKSLNQQRQAQYLLKIGEIYKESQGLNKSLVGTVKVLDNRTGRNLFTTADEYAAGSFAAFPTESILEKELLKRLAEKVSAEINRSIIAEQSTTIIFIAPPGINRSQARDSLEQGLAKVYGFSGIRNSIKFINTLNFQGTEENDQSYTFSFLVPQRIDTSKKRQFERELVKLQKQVLYAQSPVMEAGKAGQVLRLSDESNRSAIEYQVPVKHPRIFEAERLIREGKLDYPEGSGFNAFDTLREHLMEFPGDQHAEQLIQRISEILVSQAESSLDKDQLMQVSRYLERASRVWTGNPKIKKVQIPPPPPLLQKPASTSDETLLIFPEIENKTRGVSRPKVSNLTGLAADIDGIHTIFANGEKLKFKPANSQYHQFIRYPGANTIQFRVPLNEGLIEVTVNDTVGNSVSRKLIVNNEVARIAPKQTYQAGARVLEDGRFWALLIANQNYTNGLSTLKTPYHDVDHLKKVLLENYRFNSQQIIVVKDATKLKMADELYKMHDRVKGNDSLLIYYAGHGFQDKTFGHNGGKGFWIPVDGKSPDGRSSAGQLVETDSSYRTSYLPNSQVHDIVDASRAQHVLLISDSCYSGTFKSRSTDLASTYAANLDYFYGLTSKKSRRAITSGDLQPVSDIGPNDHSIFAYNLIEVLKQGGRLLSAEQLFNELRKKMSATPRRQEPQYFIMQGARDAGGDFVFVPK